MTSYSCYGVLKSLLRVHQDGNHLKVLLSRHTLYIGLGGHVRTHVAYFIYSYSGEGALTQEQRQPGCRILNGVTGVAPTHHKQYQVLELRIFAFLPVGSSGTGFGERSQVSVCSQSVFKPILLRVCCQAWGSLSILATHILA